MSEQKSSGQIQIPESAVAELEVVEGMDWGDGVTLAALIDWINQVVEMYRPKDTDARSSQNFTTRSFRHYQTLGCIDSPRRVGKRAMYGFRHYLQALLVRKLLWERVSSDQISHLLKGRSTDEYKTLLFQGIVMVPRREETNSDTVPRTWRRTTLVEGVELHVSVDSPQPFEEGEIQQILSAVERALRLE